MFVYDIIISGLIKELVEKDRKIEIWLKREEDRKLVEIRQGMCEGVNEREVIHSTVQMSGEKLTKVKEFRVFKSVEGGEAREYRLVGMDGQK